MKKLIPCLGFLVLSLNPALYSQCSGTTPLFVVDLSSSPTATWTSPSVTRNGSCCADNNCVAFLITLHPLATEISLNISSGAIPTGALFYQIGCGGLQSVGSTTCISGVGPHLVTFCKPGNNINTYTIASNPVNGSPDFTMNEGTSAAMFATGLTAGTINWTSIFPGAAGTFNSYLSCTTCSNPTINAPFGAPPMVKYVVTGSAASGCLPITRYDTINVTILDLPLAVELTVFDGNHDINTGTNHLWWQTATEVNNEVFEIERSAEATNWTKIGEVAGSGNSNTKHDYSFTDTDPYEVTYYRLIQKDTDGEKRIYGPISIIKATEVPMQYSLFPNPSSGNFFLKTNQPVEGSMYIHDYAGKLFSGISITSTLMEINIEQIPAGYYSVTLELNGKSYHSKMIIQ